MKRRNYTFALTRENERIIKIVEKYPKYAYIKHDKDSDAETHYHYYVEFPNPRSLDSVARELKIPANMLEAVYSKKGILEYLTHENQPDKFHYDKSEIVSNFDIVEDTSEVDLMQEMADYRKVRAGLMTMEEFVMSHNNSFKTLSIFSRLRSYEMLADREEQGTEGLSPFRVPSFTNREERNN